MLDGPRTDLKDGLLHPAVSGEREPVRAENILPGVGTEAEAVQARNLRIIWKPTRARAMPLSV